MEKWAFMGLILGAMTVNAQVLDHYQWKNRLLFLVADRTDDPSLQRQLAAFENHAVALKERDLMVFLMDRKKVFHKNGEMSTLDTSTTYHSLGLPLNCIGLVLVGKDGGVKYRADFPVPPNEIFDRIDAMPMRRAEMKNN